MKPKFHNLEVAATMQGVLQLMKHAVTQEEDGIRTCSVRMPIYTCPDSHVLREHLLGAEREFLHELIPLTLDRLQSRYKRQPEQEHLEAFEGRTLHMLDLIAQGRMHHYDQAANYRDYVAHIRAATGKPFEPEKMAFMEIMAAESPQHRLTTIAAVFKLYLRLVDEERTSYELLHQQYLRCETS